MASISGTGGDTGGEGLRRFCEEIASTSSKGNLFVYDLEGKTPFLVKRISWVFRDAVEVASQAGRHGIGPSVPCGILRAHDGKGRALYAMRKYSGDLFSFFWKRGKKATLLNRVQSMLLAAEKVAKLHTVMGFAHRDLKPENFVCTPDGKDVRLIDYESVVFPSIFTPGYASPQRHEAARRLRGCTSKVILEASSVDDRPHDVYSLGCMLFQAVAERDLYPGFSKEFSKKPACKQSRSISLFFSDEKRVFSRIRTALSKQQVVDGVFKAVCFEVIASAVQVDPEKRPSARAFHESLVGLMRLLEEAP